MPLVFDPSTAPSTVEPPVPSLFTSCPLLPDSSDALKSPIWPIGSTAKKLVRTFEIGREASLVTLNDVAGERPREGGEVDSSFCSNFARKEATPLGDIPGDVPADMTEATSTVSKCNARKCGRGVSQGIRHG